MDVKLLIDGTAYSGWESVSVTRSIETLSGSFSVVVSDRWFGQDTRWTIREEDSCAVTIDDEQIISGYVDSRNIELTADSRSVSFSGRDKAAALVDCSAILKSWTFRNSNLLKIARQIAAPFGITVSLQPGLTLPTEYEKIVISPGDSAYQALEQVAITAGVLTVSDGNGNIVLTGKSNARAESISEGVNAKEIRVSFDGSSRYRKYVLLTQRSGSDEASGDATRIKAEATDQGVRREDRTLLIRPEKGMSVSAARRLADWYARVRAARAETVDVSLYGWKQTSGELWPVNALTKVTSESCGISGDMLIASVTYSLDSSGEVTRLRLVRPDAFTPEPSAKVKQAEWKTE